MKGKQFKDYSDPFKSLIGVQVGNHIQSNTIEYIAEYSKQNGSNFRFVG